MELKELTLEEKSLLIGIRLQVIQQILLFPRIDSAADAVTEAEIVMKWIHS